MTIRLKPFILLVILFFVLSGSPLFGQGDFEHTPVQKDSVIINGIFWGIMEIQKVDSTQKLTTYNDQRLRYETGSVSYIYSKIYLNRFASSEDKQKIIDFFSINAFSIPKITFEYASNISKSQQAGICLQEAGILMNQRNNWRIFGTTSAVLVGVIGAGSGIGLVVPVVIGTTTWIVSLSKDYKANNQLKSAGLLLQ
jgi:hypothetical protein